MKIGVDLRLAVFGQTGGLTQWLQGVFEHLIPADPGNDYLVFCTPYNYHLLGAQTANLRRVTLSAETYIAQMQEWLEVEPVDVLFRCYPYDTDLDFPMHRQVVCICDSQHEVNPEFFSAELIRKRRWWFHRYQAMAGAIGTLTEFTRQELLASPWTRCQDIFLMPPALSVGHAQDDPAADEQARRLLPDAPYFLYPANLWPHKNHRLVLEAFARFHRAHPGVHLVLTGHPDGWDELRRGRESLPARHLGYLPPALLAAAYRRARALVFLSRYEGFGIPLLEAFAAGVPVLCSDVTALAEVGGDAALRRDPTDPDAMADGMARIATDEPLRQELIARGRARLGAYSWAASAEALRAALHRVADRAAEPAPWVAVEGPPVVSIVTPSYNQGRFIRQTIESVLSQDYPHIDYRVVDGGSTDETLEVLRGYGGRFPWTSEPDRGQTHAINKGLAQARGEILAYLNSDDVLHPGAVSRVVEHFRRRPACDLVYGRDAYTDTVGSYIGWFATRPYSFTELIEDCCISQPAAFWRRRIAEVAGPFDESLYSVMDYEYWMRIDRAGGIIEYLPHLLASTRMHPDAKTSGGDDYQVRRFRELFVSSLKHAGYISRTNFNSWLQSRVLPRYPALRRFPETIRQALQSWLTYRYIHKCRPLGAAARTTEDVACFLLRLPKCSLISWIRQKFSPRTADKSNASLAPHIPVQRWGPYLHNLLGNRVVVGAAFIRGEGELRLAGRSPVDMTLSLKVGEQSLGDVPLKAREMTDLRLPCPVAADDPRVITLEFSTSVRCPVRGEFSFELLGTNLFGERFLG